jgi:hypothetical protein
LDARYLTGYGEILDRFTIIKQTVAGVENENKNIGNIELFPNPAMSKLTVQFTLKKESDVKIEMLDINGKLLHTTTLNSKKSGNQVETIHLDKLNLPSGNYIVRINSGEETITKQFVKM